MKELDSTVAYKEEIATLVGLTSKLEKGAAIDLKFMQDATAQSMELIRKTNLLIQVTVRDKALEEFMLSILDIINQLHYIANENSRKAPKPNIIMQNLTAAFDKFFNQMISKDKREHLHDFLLTVPYVNKVIHFCEFVPSCWSYCSTAEKVAITLSVVLAVTSVAVLIASALSPAVAALPIIAEAMSGVLSLSALLYTQVTAKAMQRYDDQKRILQIKDDLDNQKDFLQSQLKGETNNSFSKLTKENITYSNEAKTNSKNKKPKDTLKNKATKSTAINNSKAKNKKIKIHDKHKSSED